MSAAMVLAPAPEETRGAAVTGRWMEVVSHLDPRYGGLSAAVPALSVALGLGGEGLLQIPFGNDKQKGGADKRQGDGPGLLQIPFGNDKQKWGNDKQKGGGVSVAAFCAPGEEFLPPGMGPETVSFWPSSRKAWLLDRGLREAFERRVRACDGLHLHGLWEQSTATGARMARRERKPYVLSAHGMLEPWALGQKRLKKLLYAHLLERANVDGAGCLHALTLAEAAQYRNFGARGPIAVIPNGVRIPQDATAGLMLERFPELAGRRVVLYLGRLHEKKGLDLLVEAWAEIAREHPEAHLAIAGPDADGTRARLEAQVTQAGLGSRVLFTGMLEAEAKWSALAAATGFVLPSHSEGLSVGVLEAMGMGVPAIVTTGCNMPEVAEHGAGWVIPASRAALADALGSLLGNSAAANREIGASGAALVRTRYSWERVARQMAEVYGWLAGGGPLPQGMPFFGRGEPCL